MLPKDLLDSSGNEKGGFTGVGRGFERGAVGICIG